MIFVNSGMVLESFFGYFIEIAGHRYAADFRSVTVLVFANYGSLGFICKDLRS